MPQTSITRDRWAQAQQFEYDEWKDNAAILESEWQELVDKFGAMFPSIARRIGLTANSTILDVGSMSTVPARLLGTGMITGLEPLAEKLGITGREKLPVVKMVAARAEEMPFPDASFDCVVCRNVIDHTQDPASIIREIQRVLKPGGHFLLICYTYAPFITWAKNVSEKYKIMRNVGHPFAFTPPMLDQLVAGKFSIVERFTIHTGQHSTDYGKAESITPDHSLVHRVLTWINRRIFGSTWFLKEYGYVAQKNI